jgi:sirohydrochlorin cobaltochelatase
MSNGLILFAHGARDPRWALPFEAVARSVQQRDPHRQVELAFLEFMTPSLAEAGQKLAQQDCTTVDVVPLFLGAGGHVRKDLPGLMAELAQRHPAVQWRLHSAIGEVSSVIEAMAQAALDLTAAGA